MNASIPNPPCLIEWEGLASETNYIDNKVKGLETSVRGGDMLHVLGAVLHVHLLYI